MHCEDIELILRMFGCEVAKKEESSIILIDGKTPHHTDLEYADFDVGEVTSVVVTLKYVNFGYSGSNLVDFTPLLVGE
jgi:hypothetical protein